MLYAFSSYSAMGFLKPGVIELIVFKARDNFRRLTFLGYIKQTCKSRQKSGAIKILHLFRHIFYKSAKNLQPLCWLRLLGSHF